MQHCFSPSARHHPCALYTAACVGLGAAFPIEEARFALCSSVLKLLSLVDEADKRPLVNIDLDCGKFNFVVTETQLQSLLMIQQTFAQRGTDARRFHLRFQAYVNDAKSMHISISYSQFCWRPKIYIRDSKPQNKNAVIAQWLRYLARVISSLCVVRIILTTLQATVYIQGGQWPVKTFTIHRAQFTQRYCRNRNNIPC